MDPLLINILLGLKGPFAYLLVFGVLLLCGLGLPIPEDITLFAAGLMSYYKVTHVYVATAVCMIGVLLGDTIIFTIGHKYGRSIASKGFFKNVLSEERLNKVSKKFNQDGNFIIFWARFMPGLRAPIFFSAGTLHLPYRVFLFYDGTASLISVPAIVYSVFYFGSELDYILGMIKKVQHLIVFFVLSWVIFFVVRWLWDKRKSKTHLKCL